MVSQELKNKVKQFIGKPIEWSTTAARNYDGFLVSVSNDFFTVVNTRFRGLIDASNLEQGKHDLALFPYMRHIMFDSVESIGICHLPRSHVDVDADVEALCDIDGIYARHAALGCKVLGEQEEEDTSTDT